jgi:hypothetical protein
MVTQLYAQTRKIWRNHVSRNHVPKYIVHYYATLCEITRKFAGNHVTFCPINHTK